MTMIMTTTSDRYSTAICSSYATTVTTKFEVQEKKIAARNGPKTLRSDTPGSWRLPFRTPIRSMYEPHEHHATACEGQLTVSLEGLRSSSTTRNPAPRAGSSFARSLSNHRAYQHREAMRWLPGHSRAGLSATSTNMGWQSQGCDLLLPLSRQKTGYPQLMLPSHLSLALRCPAQSSWAFFRQDSVPTSSAWVDARVRADHVVWQSPHAGCLLPRSVISISDRQRSVLRCRDLYDGCLRRQSQGWCDATERAQAIRPCLASHRSHRTCHWINHVPRPMQASLRYIHGWLANALVLP